MLSSRRRHYQQRVKQNDDGIRNRNDWVPGMWLMAYERLPRSFIVRRSGRKAMPGYVIDSRGKVCSFGQNGMEMECRRNNHNELTTYLKTIVKKTLLGRL